MAFAKWITFLTAVACAVYSIDPSEIGFESFAAQRSTLGGSDTAEKLSNSKDKGFRPLTSHIEGTLSDFAIADFNPDFCLRFVGIEDEDKDRVWEAKKLVVTVDELRAEEGYGPFTDPRIGALPVNPALIQPAMQMQNPQPGEGDFGAEEKPPEPLGVEFGGEAQDPGDDFGGDPKDPGDDYGAEGAEKGDDFGADTPPPAKAKAAVRKAMSVPNAGRLGNDFGAALRSSASFWRVRGPR